MRGVQIRVGANLYIYGQTCAVIIAHATHVSWEELGHSHFYLGKHNVLVAHFENIVTTRNGH